MSDATKDTARAFATLKSIIDSRDTGNDADVAAIMVTAEHAIAALLIALYRSPRLAAGMLNEGLAPGIERRLALYGSNLEGQN